jgi:hypothetical protein
MPIPMPLIGRWLAMQPVMTGEDRFGLAASSPGLVAAVAGIVGLAAERARASGELVALREAIEAALGPANDAEDPREALQEGLPPIADADPVREAQRLSALAARRALRNPD